MEQLEHKEDEGIFLLLTGLHVQFKEIYPQTSATILIITTHFSSSCPLKSEDLQESLSFVSQRCACEIKNTSLDSQDDNGNDNIEKCHIGLIL